ncbi:hypothetical protein hrd7_26850 [Leptolinea sp. HRD-7]|jgi:competence protein ComEA|nr:hypothetical protein hrd7_26850 [Leptolinea sp. HRD-7]
MKYRELNQWQSIALGFVTGAAIMAAAFVVTLPDRSVPLTLLPTATPSLLKIYITGAIKSPGVFEVPPGSRIQNVIEASGGLLQEADLQTLNLAAAVSDGQRIDIPFQSGTEDKKSSVSGTPIDLNVGGIQNIPLNRASQKELESLPGIGEEKASKILEERNKRGRFQSIDDLLEIDGFSQKLVNQIRPYLYID